VKLASSRNASKVTGNSVLATKKSRMAELVLSPIIWLQPLGRNL
jgi:hypothetical protein